MENQQHLIQQLRTEIEALQAENLELKTRFREEHDRRDIFEAASGQLQQAQLRYRTVFENSQLGNKIIGPDLKILQVNPALVRMLGFDRKTDLVGHHILEFAHPDFKSDWKILQSKLWEKHVPSFQLDTCLVRKDGKSFWVSVTSMLFSDDGGSLGFTIIENIDNRKNAVSSLVVREKRFRMITDIMPQQVWTATPDGKLNFVNEQVCDYFGRRAEVLLGNGWQEFIHPEDQERCRTLWQLALTSGNEYNNEFRLKGAASDFRWHLARAVPVHDESGISLWLGTNTDIDAQKTNELRKDEFLSIASHELKTPLTSIKLYMQLAQKAVDPIKREEFIRNTGTHIIRLERLINDLLDVSKINASKMNYEPAVFDYARMVSETVTAMQHVASKHQIVLAQNVPAQLLGDQHRIEQVLSNLLTNAIKYSPQAKEVVVKTQLVGDSVVTSVQDFGIGIEAPNLARLFDRYYRVDNTAMRFDGLGLGLYISSEILKRHNGSLWIDSEPGSGSTFHFIMPLNGQSLLTDLATDNRTYYKGNFIDIRYNQKKNRLDVDWLGYQNFESVKKGCMIMLDLLRKTGVNQVLNDNTQVMGNWSEAADWGADYWFPAMTEAGLQKFAWIYSPSVFSRLSADKSLTLRPGALDARFFDHKAEAIAWLEAAKI